MGQAQLISATTGNPQATGTIQTFTLKPGEKVVLATPPSGYEWWVMDLTPGQAGMIFMSVIGIAVAGTALAGYGLFRVVEDRIAAHRRKRFTKKLSRWFWGQ